MFLASSTVARLIVIFIQIQASFGAVYAPPAETPDNVALAEKIVADLDVRFK